MPHARVKNNSSHLHPFGKGFGFRPGDGAHVSDATGSAPSQRRCVLGTLCVK